MHLSSKILSFPLRQVQKSCEVLVQEMNGEFNSLYIREARDNFHELFPKSYGKNGCLAVTAVEEEMALKLGFV